MRLKKESIPAPTAMVAGLDGKPIRAICADCNGAVRAVDGEMSAGDMRSFRRGKRPVYATHVKCPKEKRR